MADVTQLRPENAVNMASRNSAVPRLTPESDAINRQIQLISSRDLQLWSITLLLLLVLGGGLSAVIAPNLVWKTDVVHLQVRYVPQLFFGLISLIVLFNVYVISQRRELNTTRKALVHELIFNERLQGLSLVDPLTQLFNRRALDQLLSKEIVRANRLGSSLTLLMIDLDGFKSINERFGLTVGDEFLMETAQLLKTTFRGSDTVARYGGDEFLVIMPETSEEQADRAIQRLCQEVERWNLENKKSCELSLSWGVASHRIGTSVNDILQNASRNLFMKKNKMVPVF
jgi:diguanylate cyclase (GGDEF)-like protein